MSDLYKYPRSNHLPWSPGATSDDKVLHDTSCFEFEPGIGKTVIITEKRDGECTTLYPDHYHARSLDSNNHESRNWVKGLWGSIKHEIPDNWRICGENIFAKHSVGYDDLETYFEVFSIWNEKNICLSWQETVEYCGIFGLRTVPVLFEGIYDEKFVREFHKSLDLTKQEGYVVRNAGEFAYEDFGTNLAKWVRKGHVQTDKHWMLNKITPNKLKNNGSEDQQRRTGDNP